MVKQEVTGSIGGLNVTLTIEGEDEQLANLIYADIHGRLDEINQMVAQDVPIEATEPPMTARWAESEYAQSAGEDTND